MSKSKSNLLLFVITVIALALLALFGPEEQSLGANVRIVYLHGAWVLTAELVLFAAAIVGVIALIGYVIPQVKYYSAFRREYVSRKIGGDNAHRWSAALGRTGIFFLGHIPAAFTVGDANQLERNVPRRAAFSPGCDLCGDRCVVAGGLVVDEYGLADIACQHYIYRHPARYLCNCR